MFLLTSPQGSGPGASATKFNVWREKTGVFQDVSAYRFGVVNLTGGSYPEQIHSGQVTADFFRLFGAPVTRGRTFTAEQDSPKAGRVAVISDGLWKRHFGGDPQIIGKNISLSGEPYEVIGIIGASFDSEKFDPIPDVWIPFQIDPNSTDQAHYFLVSGRLKPGVTVSRANAQLQLAADEFRRKFPGSAALGPKDGFSVKLLQEATVDNVRSSLRILLGAVTFVLLIACANVANLLLVRATAGRAKSQSGQRRRGARAASFVNCSPRASCFP